EASRSDSDARRAVVAESDVGRGGVRRGEGVAVDLQRRRTADPGVGGGVEEADEGGGVQPVRADGGDDRCELSPMRERRRRERGGGNREGEREHEGVRGEGSGGDGGGGGGRGRGVVHWRREFGERVCGRRRRDGGEVCAGLAEWKERREVV